MIIYNLTIKNHKDTSFLQKQKAQAEILALRYRYISYQFGKILIDHFIHSIPLILSEG
ncbi:hypothetical protein DOT_3353 [Desulfosporosinus sp. OT]|nr:hypothetical protein DOT_3353 [Desulfosporosinus sp. OT]